MRKGIFTEKDGVRYIDMQKVVGKGFGNGWFTNCHCRYRVFCGARNTGKSKRILGYETIFKILSDPRRNAIICRQDAVNNKQSTFANLMRCISDLGLDDAFKSKLEPLEIVYIPTGQKIIFRGLNQPTSITSIEPDVGFWTDLNIEEAYEVPSLENFEMLDGSVRAGGDFDEEGNIVQNDVPLQITLLLNPWSKNWIYDEFFHGMLEDDYEYLESHNFMDYKDENYQGAHGKGIYLHKSTYKVNEFRNVTEVDTAADEMKIKNPDMYKVVYLGMWGAVGQITYPEFGEQCLRNTGEILNTPCMNYAIGIDAGFSNGEGKKRVVRKGDDPVIRVRAATTMCLIGITPGYNQIFVVDEYYHTNIASRFDLNTDCKQDLTMPEISANIIKSIIEWKDKYGSGSSMLMKGQINCYVDNADLGFRQTLEIKAREMGLYNVQFIASTKTPINGRVLFEKLLMSYGDLCVDKIKCKNLIREIRNARGDDKGNIRSDEDDHMITALEYGFSPFKNSFAKWKSNFKDQ